MSRLLNIPEATFARLHAELAAGGSPALPGAVRASIGIGTTADDVDRLVHALYAIAQAGPHAHYEHAADHDEYRPLALRTAV